MYGKTLLNLILICGLFCSAPALSSCIYDEDIAKLVNQRLAYMKEVAGYKMNHHLAIEDLAQEASVMQKSVYEAEALGLNKRSVEPFIQAQIDVAKAIQYRYYTQWRSVSENKRQPASLNQIRSKLTALDVNILKNISLTLASGCKFIDRTHFDKVINQSNVTKRDKNRLWNSMIKITLNGEQKQID